MNLPLILFPLSLSLILSFTFPSLYLSFSNFSLLPLYFLLCFIMPFIRFLTFIFVTNLSFFFIPSLISLHPFIYHSLNSYNFVSSSPIISISVSFSFLLFVSFFYPSLSFSISRFSFLCFLFFFLLSFLFPSSHSYILISAIFFILLQNFSIFSFPFIFLYLSFYLFFSTSLLHYILIFTIYSLIIPLYYSVFPSFHLLISHIPLTFILFSYSLPLNPLNHSIIFSLSISCLSTLSFL